MDIREYQEKAERTINYGLNFNEQVSNLCMGLAGETGEVIDIIKKCFYHGHKLDKEKQYIANNIDYTKMAYNLNISEEDIPSETIAKKDINEKSNIINNIF